MNNTNNKFKHIISNKDSQFKIKIEDISEFNNSFFRDVYEDATRNLYEILDNNKEYYLEKNRLLDNKFKYIDKEEKNNIIAFAGERGSGKTSAMVSFAGALNSKNKEMFEPMERLKNEKFWVLNSIDPSLFEENESIFQVVIAKLFEEFRRDVENNSNNMNRETNINEEAEIIRTFEKVYKNFKIISEGSRYNDNISLDDTLEALSNLAASSSMRENFIKLVQGLLEYKYGKAQLENSYLILSIDDLDMNITKSSDMAEQIRKYLLIPNVIILMAVKVEQLKDSIEQMFRKEYEIMTKNKIELEDDPKNMAARYVEKLIPNGRKIYLPNLKIGDNLDSIKIEVIDNKSTPNSEEITGVQECILGMIYKKTGMIFVKPREGVHFLIPDNLRELQNLLATLTNLKDIEFYVNTEKNKNESFVGIQVKNKKDLTKNIETFERYFYNIWIKKNLYSKDISIIDEFRLKPIAYKNKFIVCKVAQKKILENKDSEINEIKTDEFGPYVEMKNKSYNVSLGDVLDVLDINKDYDSENMQKFKFAIKTVYSLEIHKRLYFEEYNEIYDENTHIEKYINSRVSINENLFKLNYSKGINDIYTLTAGNILGEIYRLLTRNIRGSDTQGRSEWKINEYNKMSIIVNFEEKELCFKLDSLIKFLDSPVNEERIDRLIEEILSKDYIQNESKELLKQSIEKDLKTFEIQCKQSIELVHNFIYQGYDLENKKYRTNEEKYYDMSVSLTTGFAHKSATFSIYALFTKALKINNIYESLTNISNKTMKVNNVNVTIYPEIVEYIDMNKSYILLPINSIESLEYIKEYLYKYKNKLLDSKYSYENDEYFENIIKTSYKLIYNSLEDLNKHISYIGDKNNTMFLKTIETFSLTKYLLHNKEIDNKDKILFETMSKNINLIRVDSEKLNKKSKKTDEEKKILESLKYKLIKCKTKSTNGKAPTYSTIRKKWTQFNSLLDDYNNLKKDNYKLITNLNEIIDKDGTSTITSLRQNDILRDKFYYEFEKTLDEIIEKYNLQLSNIEI